MIQTPEYQQTKEQIAERIAQYEAMPLKNFNEKEAYRFALSCIDLTTLEGSDNSAKIQQLCEKAITLNTAAVCVYPPFIKQAKEILKNTTIKVASVAGAFPSGQSPLFVKLAEVAYAVEEGADEIDMVISRGKFLEGNDQEVFDEIVAIKKACKNAHLKVILETGELLDPKLIFKASFLAMKAGADFIKTSTGKINISATPEAFLVMLDAINQYYNETGTMVGMKPAGGISDQETTLLYLKILENTLNNKWLNNQYFRIGASRLADKLI
ncbi:MAG TPA: deoxyribose-phosphate aldolase [Bacteroidales bacterium]|jgi:deoxyribose-phosphate aldolase|nr:deoxyribose-phosphate aldolase [Bacteroidales bacterium]HPS71663.1 deoxyribose-phosphate aldolase [Bacteroidales bacterium]